MEQTVADAMAGRLVDGRYRVGDRIARGGMATVYQATDTRLDRVVALKVMHPGLGGNGDFAARFVREARSAARLSHPNVVAVYDQGDDDGTLYLAMEYVEGRTLRDEIRLTAPLPPARALALVDPVLSALAAAHRSGMIHRDVKPENVLLADDGRVKVADFGLARAVSADTQHTATGGVLIGTVSYLSPELVMDGRADARSDVYATGVLLYELLTGRKPHEGESPIQVAYKHVHEDVPPPSGSVAGIPPYVDALVARATARDRDLRPADAHVLLQQVRRVRAALDHGLDDDPELTADLAPAAAPGDRRVAEDTGDLDETSPRIVEPQAAPAVVAARRPDGTEPTSVIRRQGPAPRPRRGPLLLVLAIVLAVLAATAGWYYAFGRYTTTPAVVDLPRSEARAQVEAEGLTFEVEGRDYSETVRAGSVIGTDPGAGERVLEGGTVSAVLSRGPERYDVPRLRGMTEDEAREALDEGNLSVGDVSSRFSEKLEEGVVLGSSPEEGASLRRDTAVDLVVSKGPRPIKVPDLSGEPVAEARSTLLERGLKVDTTRRNHDEVAEGRVLSQEPSAGTLFRGDTVELVVSDGPVMVEVPAVRGAGVAEARERLEAAGFEVRTERSAVYVGLEYVVATDPEAGSMAPRGSVVTLSLV